MLSSFYSDTYKKPADQKFPAGAELINDTDFPNLNSIEYRQTPVERTVKIYPIWESIAINDQKHIVIGTNKCTGREWCSALWGFENIDDIQEKNSVFRLSVSELFTQIQYLSNSMFLATFRSGAVELWSTYTQVRNSQKPYCLFMIAKSYEHLGPIEYLETMEPRTHKAITGGQDFTLKIWDWSEEELQSSHTYRYAHVDTITGISHSKLDDSIFATCSRDKSVLLWDLRLVRPAQALYLEHNCSFQDITWLNSSKDAADNLLCVGDAAGYLHTIDKRATKQFLSSQKHFDRSIRKLLCNGANMAVIADTNIVKVLSATAGETVYENKLHTHFVRDCVWYDDSKLLTVGSDSHLHVHNISA